MHSSSEPTVEQRWCEHCGWWVLFIPEQPGVADSVGGREWLPGYPPTPHVHFTDDDAEELLS